MVSQQELRQWFDQIDRDRNGSLDVFELQRALALGNLNFSLKTVAHMIRLHDSDANGTIDYTEFEKLHTFIMQVQQSFFQMDTNRDGQLSVQEVEAGLRQAGFNLDRPAFLALFKGFDPDRTSTLSLPEYVAMSLFLQSAVRTFTAFDPQRQGRVSLDFNQFIYAAANLG